METIETKLHQPGSFLNWGTAALCAHASELAYSGAGIGSSWDKVFSIYDASTDTKVIISELEDATLVAVKGTDSLRDWLIDGEFWMRQLYSHQEEFGRVHAGFYEAYRSVADKVDAEIQRIDKPVIFTGHSLGGAIGVLLAHLYSRVSHVTTMKGVYTFGQPRVGDAAFARNCHAQFGDRHFRFVDEVDIVARIPGLLAGYRHSGQCQFLSGDTVVENPSLFLKLIQDGFSLWRLRNSGPAAIALGITKLIEDHSMSKYAVKIDALRDAALAKNS